MEWYGKRKKPSGVLGLSSMHSSNERKKQNNIPPKHDYKILKKYTSKYKYIKRSVCHDQVETIQRLQGCSICENQSM